MYCLVLAGIISHCSLLCVGDLKTTMKSRYSLNSKSSLESSADARQASDLQRHGSERSRPRKRENSSKGTEKKSTLPTRIIERVTRTMYEIAEDFTDDSPKESAAEEKDTRVNITILKENVKRFGAALKPYINTVKGIQGLLHWKSAPYTLVVFMVYMYAVWCGWAVQMFILCLIFRHFISYLQSVGMKIKFNFLDHEEENNLKKEDSSLGLSDKINLVVQISKKVQDYLGKAADSLEKIESVLTWRYRPAAQRLFLALCGFFVISVVVNFDLLLCVIGINMGIKLFLINHVYYKFPRIKQKYDSMSRLWTMLPTRQSWEKSHIQSHIDKYVLPDVNKCAEEDTTESGLENIENSTEIDPSDENKAFFQLFCLPASEILLSGWRGGRRCTLVDRRKRGMGAFKNGKLYLTKSFICFERKCIPSKENLLIPLVDIVTVTKSKPFHFMPGSGMAIEVTVKERSFVFGGLLNRDDAYDSIQEHGVNKGLPWATGIPLDESSPCPNIVRLTENKQNFSFPVEYGDSE
ncbi:GRAM domain-containing protein 4-like isoform X2 [Ostrea edulis]|uniref:GRAM domain-containing protein 4-like isoform X2 n=1 Tax=Ostrea edulis TaxID=37623 RepID=UPI0024AEA55B|nr:GRAM domain-containing protein 4-like isoform X2 [Ostrea edulis]